MSIYKDLKKAFGATIDMIADKTSLQAQKSRLLTVMKNEEKTADRAYIALGKYLYTTMREGLPEDVEQLCKIVDTAKENMTRAQELYRDVLRQDELVSAQNTTEVKENFRKVSEPIAAGAASTATKASSFVKAKAKDTAAKAETLKTAAAERAQDIRQKAQQAREEQQEAAAQAASAAQAEKVNEAEPEDSEYDEEFIGDIEPTPEEIYDIPSEAPAPQPIPVEPAVAEESAPTESAPETIDDEPAAPVAAAQAAEAEPAPKPVVKTTKAQRLHDIISKRNSGNSAE